MMQEVIEKLTLAVANEMGMDPDRVNVMDVTKDNGVRLTGISVRGGNIGAVCYVNGYVEELEAGAMPYDVAAREICQSLKVPEGVREHANAIQGMSKEQFLDGIEIRLLNAELNKEIREKCPCFDYIDLIGVFHHRIDSRMSFRITNEMAARFDVSLEELKAAGIKNTEKGKKVATMAEMMAWLMPGGGEPTEEEKGVPLWVFTNDSACYGASIMLLPDPFEELAEKLGSDLYILPSSKHEVLVLPKDAGNDMGLSELVRGVNGSVVAGEDFLSNTVYQYTRGSGVIDVAA